MKKILLILLCLSSAKSHSQTYDEWFRQKKTQKKYLIDQIVALQTYIGYAQKGYSIAAKGISTIKNISKGDFSIHNDFFNSLSVVNPRVKKYIKVADIIAAQVVIAKLVHTTLMYCRNEKQFTGTELKYVDQVFNNLLDDCAKNLDELFELITDSQQQLKDDERIKRIDRVYEDMLDKQVFARSFSHSVQGLSNQRRNDQYDILIEKKLNNTK